MEVVSYVAAERGDKVLVFEAIQTDRALIQSFELNPSVRNFGKRTDYLFFQLGALTFVEVCLANCVQNAGSKHDQERDQAYYEKGLRENE